MAIITKIENNKCGPGCRETRTFIHCWWEYKVSTDTLENTLTVSLKVKHKFTIGSSNSIPRYTLVCVLSRFSRVQLSATPWTVTYRASLSMGFSRQEYWSGLPCLPPGDLPYPGIESESLMSPRLAGGFFTTSTTWKAPKHRNPYLFHC